MNKKDARCCLRNKRKVSVIVEQSGNLKSLRCDKALQYKRKSSKKEQLEGSKIYLHF